jgi:dUTP pyrophosphatase
MSKQPKQLNLAAHMTGTVKKPEFVGAGYEVTANINLPIWIKSGEIGAVPTGLFFEVPEGYELQVRSLTDLVSSKHLEVLGQPLSYASSFKGELIVELKNNSRETFQVKRGDRIALLTLSKINDFKLDFIGAMEFQALREEK